MRGALLLTLCLATIAPAVSAAGSSAPALLQAMAHEVMRAADSLRLENQDEEVLLVSALYRLDRTWAADASQGLLEQAGRDLDAQLELEILVGDSALDQTRFRGGSYPGGALPWSLPQDGDTLLVRRAIWAAADAGFKNAIEKLAAKRAWLAEHPGAEKRLSRRDLQIAGSPAACQTYTADEPLSESPLDTAKILERLRTNSALTRGSSWLNEARVAVRLWQTDWYYADSFGRCALLHGSEHTWLAALATQAPSDGNPLWDYVRITSRAASDWKLAEVDSLLKDRIARLEAVRQLPPASPYRGPVLLKEQAAGAFLWSVLGEPITLLEEEMALDASEEPFLPTLLGRRLFPPGYRIFDNPTIRTFNKQALQGYLRWDHQGRAAKPFSLVEDGMLLHLPEGRAALPGGAGGGHWRFGTPFPSVMVLEGPRPISSAAMDAEARRLATSEGEEAAIAILRFEDRDALDLLRSPLTQALRRSRPSTEPGIFLLPQPLAIDALVSGSTAKRPLRSLEFPAFDSRSLRFLVAVGDRPHLWEPYSVASLLTPDLLIGLADLRPARAPLSGPALLSIEP